MATGAHSRHDDSISADGRKCRGSLRESRWDVSALTLIQGYIAVIRPELGAWPGSAISLASRGLARAAAVACASKGCD